MVVDVGFLDVVMDVFGVTPFGSDDIFVKVLSERFCFTDATVSRCHCLALGVGLVEIFADEFLVVVVTLLVVVGGAVEAAVVPAIVVLVLVGVDDDGDDVPTIPEKILLVGCLLLGSWL